MKKKQEKMGPIFFLAILSEGYSEPCQTSKVESFAKK